MCQAIRSQVKNLPTWFSSAALSLAGENTVMSCLQPHTGVVCSGHNISIAQISPERALSRLTLSHQQLSPARTLLLRRNQQFRAIPAVPSPLTATSVQRDTLHQERESPPKGCRWNSCPQPRKAGPWGRGLAGSSLAAFGPATVGISLLRR